MSYKVDTIDFFDKQLKRLAKKYPSLKSEYAALIELLEETPQGDSIGKDCFKIRLSIESKGKGKAGGARVIYYAQFTDGLIVLLTIYDKAEKENISAKDLEVLLAKIPW